jgi:hypothetical protein
VLKWIALPFLLHLIILMSFPAHDWNRSSVVATLGLVKMLRKSAMTFKSGCKLHAAGVGAWAPQGRGTRVKRSIDLG